MKALLWRSALRPCRARPDEHALKDARIVNLLDARGRGVTDFSGQE